MKEFQNLNSPLQHIDTINEVELWLKRDDLIHPQVSGNKWRKLKYYLEDFRNSGKDTILTFGGAFSNHLAATAALGNLAGIETKALVRGEEVDSNATLYFCREMGMELEAIPRKRYATKDDPEFLELLYATLPGVYVIPEGGKGPLGVKGCTEILDEVDHAFDIVCASAGTATTVTGLLLGAGSSKIWCFPALKGGQFLQRAIAQQAVDYCREFSTKQDVKKLMEHGLLLQSDYHFSGYAKVNDELIDFMNTFYQKYGVKLDPVYTGKMMFGIMDLIRKGIVAKGSKVLCLHTGGLQGIAGMNEALRKKIRKTLAYEA